MKSKLVLGFSVLTLTALVFTACSKIPQAEIDQANQAIDSARIAGADVYVPEAFLGLQDSMKSVTESIEAQKSKLFKNYGSSKEKLAQITQQAKDVVVQSETKKEELKKQVQETLAEITTLLKENKKIITEAPKGKEGTTALMAMKNEITTIETSVGEANTMFEKGEYMAASIKVKSSKEQAMALNTELKEIIAKYKGAKGKKV